MYLLAAPLVVPSAVGHHYYTLFYLLAFLLNQVLLWRTGQQRHYPLRTWLLTLACVSLAFILGTKLIAIPATEWPALLHTGQWPTSPARSVLGGAVAGTLALLGLRRWLGYSWHLFDAFALPMCATLAVQGIGCLLTGCCFGELATTGPSLSYAPGTLPYLVQLHRGLITDAAAHSLPVQPVQLYSILLYVSVGAVLLGVRQRAWPGGSQQLLHLGLVLGGRFLLEFLRDPAGEQVGAAPALAVGPLLLKQVQLPLLLCAVVALAWWYRLVRRARLVPPTPERPPAERPLRNLAGVALLLLLTAKLGPGALTLPELLAIRLVLLSVLVLEGVRLLRGAARRPRVAFLPLGAVALVFVLTSQAAAPADSGASRNYLAFGVYAGQGAFDQDLQNTSSGGCSGSSYTARRAYYHRYTIRGGELSYNYQVKPDGSRRTVGVRVQAGTQHITFQELTPGAPFPTTGAGGAVRQRLLDLNPYYERVYMGDQLDVGYRFGLHLGNLGQYPRSAFDTLMTRQLFILPDFQFWLGRREVLFGQVESGYGVQGIGNYTAILGVGSGFGSHRGGYLLAGYAAATMHRGNSGSMGFVRASVPLFRTGLWLEPYGATNFGRLHQASVQVRYHLPTGKAR